MASGREVVERYIKADVDSDWDTLQAMRHDDWIEDWPQSGERIIGHDNYRRIHENFPQGMPAIEVGKPEGSDPTYAISPSYTLVKISGAGDTWVVQGVNRYPSGDVYRIVKLIQLRDDRVHHETTYFAQGFEAPAWRAEWVTEIPAT